MGGLELLECHLQRVCDRHRVGGLRRCRLRGTEGQDQRKQNEGNRDIAVLTTVRDNELERPRIGDTQTSNTSREESMTRRYSRENSSRAMGARLPFSLWLGARGHVGMGGTADCPEETSNRLSVQDAIAGALYTVLRGIVVHFTVCSACLICSRLSGKIPDRGPG